jgi:hypothetical protein
MKLLHLLAIGAAMAALPILAATDADAQQRAVGGPRITFPSHANHFSWEGHHGFHGGVFIVEREVPIIIEREVVREVAVTPPPTPPHQGEERKRKPYVIGSTYASLPPQGCMKLIEDGASYYFCGGGDWYRLLGDGRDAKYRAVAKP